MRKILSVVALLTVASLAAVAAPAAPIARPCAPGTVMLGSEREPAYNGALSTALDGVVPKGADGGVLCVPRNRPESFRELAAREAQLTRAATGGLGLDAVAGAYRESLKQRDAMIAGAASTTGVAKVAGAGGLWKPYSKGPLISDDPRFPSVASDGNADVNGRIDSLDYDPVRRKVFALAGTGGVWMSSNLGESWVSIGERLPTQVNGALAWTKARGGRLIVVSGEALIAGGSRTGLGAFYTPDYGKTWVDAKGVPDGGLGFKVAVDPTNPNVVYVATSKGLYRSQDAGANYVNVKLPTGVCAGKTDNQRCLLANMVTDVVVQAPDKFGNRGGRVLAVVGYRAGKRKFPQNPTLEESPNNGLYRSDNGKPGTFVVLPGTGFAPQERIGRTELGVATGAAQNHNYVYAIVSDAVLFQGGFPSIDAPEDVWVGASASALNGIYVSADFGSTWTLMADTHQISNNPATGSSLAVVGQGLQFPPGVQAWYNEWILPDPTRQTADGVPTRLTFGLEEVWQNDLTDRPQNSRSTFKVIGRYTANESCQLLATGLPACPFNRDPIAKTTTHADQQSGLYIPDGKGGVTLVAGNDGGTYKQTVAAGEEFDNTKWGRGINLGPNTLLPYQARAAKDGRVWFGLQDNGSGYIDGATRKQYQTFGGDGFYVAVDPNNSDYAWSETTAADMRSTIDGGRTWKDNQPTLTNAQFSNAFVMDPTDSKHLLTAGTDIVETVDGHDTCTRVDVAGVANAPVECTWKQVFHLGTKDSPGVEAAEPTAASPANIMSAVDVNGANAYVGFCGPCDIMNSTATFATGIATNVGGSAKPAKASTSGWHVAKARGLPARFINSVTVDPKNPRTVYVTLGGYARGWRGPGSFGDANKNIGRGHVYVSRDAGESFTDISGSLPNAPTKALALRGSQIIVGTDVGVFLSRDRAGKVWAPLNKGLPVVPVSSVQVLPGDSTRLMISTFGRGMWEYKFPSAAASRSRSGIGGWFAGSRGRGPSIPAGLLDPATLAVLLAGFGAAILGRRRRAYARI